jgi:PIN domain nuclease of toxin-antitoxin system
LTPDKLTKDEKAALSAASISFVSVVSLWEIATLMRLDRIAIDERLLNLPAGFDLLPVQPEHCREYAQLQQIHRDPFDRMLIAQAKAERVPLLTRDRNIALYGRMEAPVLLLH